jgi:hypothetical protein
LIEEEIKRRLNSGNACYHWVQNLLSSSVLSKNVKVRIYKTIILPVVLYGCETLSLTVREEHKLSVFENRVLKRIFGPKGDGVTGGWGKLHNEEFHNKYEVEEDEVGGTYGTNGRERLLVRKPEGKRPLERPRRRWMDNIKMDLLEIGLNVVDWIGLAQDRYRWRAPVNSVMNLRIP